MPYYQCLVILRKVYALDSGTLDIPKPREATSVAMRMGALPLRNSAIQDEGWMMKSKEMTWSHCRSYIKCVLLPDNTQSLSGWLLSP